MGRIAIDCDNISFRLAKKIIVFFQGNFAMEKTPKLNIYDKVNLLFVIIAGIVSYIAIMNYVF